MSRYRLVCALIALYSLLYCSSVGADEGVIPSESVADAQTRHQRVAERRDHVQIICHRGSAEFAHENTLEAYRASFYLGADGNEIDIRATKDGVLICFHDDMLDQLLEAYGDASDYTWDELRRLRFRAPGRFAKDCRIPTLIEVLELHRQHAGLVHLDIKRPELIDAVKQVVVRMDMWDHIVAMPSPANEPRYRECAYKASLYQDRADVDRDAIAKALDKPGDSVIVDDPRAVATLLGRKLRNPPSFPVAPVVIAPPDLQQPVNPDVLVSVLRDADDWNHPLHGEKAEAEADAAARIIRRAQAADRLAEFASPPPEAFGVLRERVKHRNLHPQWRYHGLDGAAVLRALIKLRAPDSVELARYCLWRDDPDCAMVANPAYKHPGSWTDWRTKVIVFAELAKLPGLSTQQLCHDYLALSDEEASAIGPVAFESAAKTLLTLAPKENVAVELLKHRRGDVRGRTILFCLAHANQDWAIDALTHAAPEALAYIATEN